MVYAMPWHDNADADANVWVVRVCDRETMSCRLLFPVGAEPPPGSGYLKLSLSRKEKGYAVRSAAALRRWCCIHRCHLCLGEGFHVMPYGTGVRIFLLLLTLFVLESISIFMWGCACRAMMS
jgi:hypothetical protein